MDRNKLEARIARLEKLIKNEDALLSHMIKATHNVVNDLVDRIKNPEKQSKLLDMIIHKEDKAINTIINFIQDEYDFSRGYLLSKKSIIADEASEVAGALAIYSDWEDKGYFDGDGDFNESVKNEGFDISADVFNWFNKYCCDILDKDKSFGWKDLKEALEDADTYELADRAIEDIAADTGVLPDSLEVYRDQIEYDLDSLIIDALDYIKYGDTDHSFNKNNADWMDRYKENDEYTASLESRISKLEKKLKNENVPLNAFDCKALLKILENNIKSTGAKADISDDNADYGFISIAIYNPDYVTDYDIIADEFDSFEVNNEDKSVGKAKSFEEIGKLIADHYKENFWEDNVLEEM